MVGANESTVMPLEAELLSLLPTAASSKRRRSRCSSACRSATTLAAVTEKVEAWRRAILVSDVALTEASEAEEYSK